MTHPVGPTALPAPTGTVLEVRIGARAVTYHLYETTAPRAYDGFGTRTVCGADGETRYVLVAAEFREWQTMGYASGMYGAAPSDVFTADDLGERLWRAMSAPLA